MNRSVGFGVAAFFAVVLLALSSLPEQAQAGHRRHGCCGVRHRHHRHHRVHRGGCHGAYYASQPAAVGCCGTAPDYGCAGGAMVDGGVSNDALAPPPPAPEMPEGSPGDAGASPSDNPPPAGA
jgi:hypothetical protein